MSAFLSQTVIREVIRSVKPLFFPEKGSGMFLSLKTLAICVITTPSADEKIIEVWGSDTDETTQEFIKYAQIKSEMALRNRMDTLELRNRPHLFTKGDFGWPGGVYRYDEITVGVSGANWWNVDHMIAAMISEALFATAMKEFRRSENNPEILNFIQNA